ncbi:Bax inhibitor-1/YccA family protein [Herbaspirillum sp. SJZ107]|jgi:modulator of FtsH protease|uniref:Bax inhibitor-1/YccA family protein n=1 Tax=Herbaspirillum sp. SJZ107 TaxID=2572881 RepID=UPI001152F335|nr:Bax inhibitor-1/YccA family protein [Herbaspirillum sp. SJZ107]TQK07927.1 modulator of FtsH protease [Herbaspirillum sp. SJZ107]
MIPSLQKPYGGVATQAARNRVVRNTYWLLALSMIPTVFGAYLGVTSGLFMPRGVMGMLLFFAVAFGFIFAIEKTKNSAAGIPVLLGFTFFMGLMLAPLLRHTLGFANGPALIMGAFAGTSAVFGVMATIATVSKRDFSGMGSWLFAGTIVVLLAMVANVFLQIPALHLALLVMVVGIFSAWLLFDVQRVVNGGETNYITATLSIYLDIYNIFTALLQLLGIGFGNRD